MFCQFDILSLEILKYDVASVWEFFNTINPCGLHPSHLYYRRRFSNVAVATSLVSSPIIFLTTGFAK
ncbi:hypothetical protein V6Z12_A04G111400 [Gossypium hirsutum]